jgi:uncharacterized MAPEG superfamily protein
MSLPLELFSLLGSVAILWLIGIAQTLETMRLHGISGAVGNRAELPATPSGYAGRLTRLGRNHVEGLAIFAPIVLACLALDVSNPYTQTGALMVLAGRILHAILYALGIPWLRSIVFVGLVDIGLFVLGFGLLSGLL